MVGVGHKGDTAWQINELFADRQRYLFDTFEGFDKRDLDLESGERGSGNGESGKDEYGKGESKGKQNTKYRAPNR